MMNLFLGQSWHLLQKEHMIFILELNSYNFQKKRLTLIRLLATILSPL
jgi:hypothetical protein